MKNPTVTDLQVTSGHGGIFSKPPGRLLPHRPLQAEQFHILTPDGE